MMARPDCAASDKAYPVPDNVKMLPPVLDVFDNHALVMEHLVAVFFFAAGNNRQNLRVGQAFILHWIDADMVQRLFAFCSAGDLPHFLKRLVKVLGRRIADFYKARFLVLALLLHIVGGGAIAAPDVAFDNQ